MKRQPMIPKGTREMIGKQPQQPARWSPGSRFCPWPACGHPRGTAARSSRSARSRDCFSKSFSHEPLSDNETRACDAKLSALRLDWARSCSLSWRVDFKSLPLWLPSPLLGPGLFQFWAEDARSVSRDQGLVDCAITRRLFQYNQSAN